MASRAKPTGSKRNATTSKKPATIDLDAKEVNKEADAKPATAAKTSSSTSTSSSDKSGTSQNFGRPDAKKNEPAAKTDAKADASAAKKTDSKDTAKTDSAAKETSRETTEKKAEKPAPASKEPQPAPKSSGSFLGKLGYAFMGGVAALAGFGAIGIWDGARELPLIGNFYGGSSGAQTAQVSPADLEALRSEIASLRDANSGTDAITGLTTKLESLEASVSELSSLASDTGTLGEKVTELEQSFGAVNTSIAEITAAAADGSNTSPAALSTAINALDGRIETLEAGIETVRESVIKNPALDEISSTLGDLKTEIDTVAQSVGAVSQSVATLQKSADNNAQSLAGLAEQSETLETTVASVKASEKVARSVAVNALATALENDDALSLPISSVKALVGETPETTRLEALNAKGIPSGKDLQTSLGSFISTVRSPNEPPKDGSITERFWANAQSMVSFRASGPREGDDPLSILSRVEANVKDGNLQSAKAEWEKLPADVAEQGASWLTKLNTRIEAFALQEALNQKLTAEAG